MKKVIPKTSLEQSGLSRVYSNPQFQSLNQVPYIRPKTSAFGYPNGDEFK